MKVMISAVAQIDLLDLMDSITYRQEQDDIWADENQINARFKEHSSILQTIDRVAETSHDEIDILPFARLIQNFINTTNFVNERINKKLALFIDHLLKPANDANESTFLDLILEALAQSTYPTPIPEFISLRGRLQSKNFKTLPRVDEVINVIEHRIKQQLVHILSTFALHNLEDVFSDSRLKAFLTEEDLKQLLPNEFGELVPFGHLLEVFATQTRNPSAAIITPSEAEARLTTPVENLFAELGLSYRARVLNNYNSPEHIGQFVNYCKRAGIDVILVAATEANALARTIARFSLTTQPPLQIIALPLSFGVSANLTPNHSQLPPGVVTVSTNDVENAAFSCMNMIAANDCELAERLVDYMQKREDLLPNPKRTRLLTTAFDSQPTLPWSEANEVPQVASALTSLRVSNTPAVRSFLSD